MQSMCLELTKNDVAASLEVDNDSIAVAAFHRGWPKARLSPLDNIIWSRPPSCRQAHSELCLWACVVVDGGWAEFFCFVAIRNRPPSTVSLQPKKLRAEMCLSGCLYNRSSAVSLGVTCEAFARTKKLPDSLIAAAQCTNYSLVLPWHFKLKDKQIETL